MYVGPLPRNSGKTIITASMWFYVWFRYIIFMLHQLLYIHFECTCTYTKFISVPYTRMALSVHVGWNAHDKLALCVHANRKPRTAE